ESTLAPDGDVSVSDVGWRDFFVDDKLETLVASALASNRDLRVAVLNVERTRQLYRIQRAERVPSVDGNITLARTGGELLPITNDVVATVGVTGFELDLFGRVHNLSQAALARYFAQEAARRAAQLTLIAELAN